MIIKPRPILDWIYNPGQKNLKNILLPPTRSGENRQFFIESLQVLDKLRTGSGKWGLPELVMNSFINVMEKNAPAFKKVMSSLYEEFSKNKCQGVLLLGDKITIPYIFEDDDLLFWNFMEVEGSSLLSYFAMVKYRGEDVQIFIPDSIISDNEIFGGTLDERRDSVGLTSQFISIYEAVKRYVPVEIVVVPKGKFTQVEDTPLQFVERKKVLNQCGQEVIVMDSKWFRKIVNDNEIQVRGFFRMQNKKDSSGQWYRELIYIDPHVRHGYHRNALVENEPSD